MSIYETLFLEKSGPIATITLNRPDAANGINPQLALELADAALDVDKDENIRCVILTANGKFFCAGGDLKSMTGDRVTVSKTLKNMADNLHRATSTFARMPKPIIIAVNGTAAGAGFSIALTGDLVISSDKAKFTMAYTAAGLSPDGSSSYYLPRLIGLRRTAELMITNRVLSAEEAQNWGMINQVVPAEDLMKTTTELAEKLAQGPTNAYGSVKKLLNMSFNNSLEAQMEIEGRYISQHAADDHGQEGISAFLEKRKPNFK